MSRKLLPILAAEVIILAFYYLRVCHHIAGGYGFPLDDSWIHAMLARNIAEGHGIVYNPGQHVTTTAMLYTVLLAGLYKIVASPIFSAAVLGLLLHLASSFTVYLIARGLLPSEIWAAACAVIFVAIPRLMWGALSGMEVPLYVFLVTLGIYWHMLYRWDEGWKAYLGTLAFSLSALARPECAAFVALALAERFTAILVAEPKKSAVLKYLKTVPLHLAVFIVVLLPLLAFNYASYGMPLPPAFYAKTRAVQDISASARALMRLATAKSYLGQAAIVSVRDSNVLAYALIPGLFGIWRLYRKSPMSGVLILPLGMMAVPALTGMLACIGVGKSQLIFQVGRYSGYLIPILVIVGVLGIVELGELIARASASLASVGRAVVPGLLAGALVLLVLTNIEVAEYFSQQVQNINAMQVVLGKWAASLPEDAVLAVNDAGAIPFFSHRRILDTVGVVNPQVVPYLRKHKDRQIGLLRYLEEKKPDYVIIFPNWYRKLAARTDILHPVKTIKLKHNVVCGGPVMTVYKPDWHAAKLRPEL